MHEGRTTENRRMTVNSRTLGMLIFGTALAVCSVIVNPGRAAAVEVGEPAPDFTLPSTTGADISLSDFKGKKFVFLESKALGLTIPTPPLQRADRLIQ